MILCRRTADKKNVTESFYRQYTSTAALSGVDEKSVLVWSIGYFARNYASLLPKEDKSAAIAELACGYGRYLMALEQLGYTNCVGIDISDEQVAYARSKLGLRNVEKADALVWLSTKNASYDCILAIDFLEHLPTDDLLSMGNMIYKALKPGGRLIIQVPNAMSPANPVIYGDLTHVRAFTEQSIRQFLLLSGLRNISCAEVPPYYYDAKSLLRYVLWKYTVKPLLHVYSLIAHGKSANGIYSDNFIIIAEK